MVPEEEVEESKSVGEEEGEPSGVAGGREAREA